MPHLLNSSVEDRRARRVAGEPKTDGRARWFECSTRVASGHDTLFQFGAGGVVGHSKNDGGEL